MDFLAGRDTVPSNITGITAGQFRKKEGPKGP